MGVIHDIYNKIAHWRQPVTIYAEDHAEKLTCSICGKQYISRGKWDPGVCRDCERKETEKNAHLIGGPLDGGNAYDEG